VHWNAMPSEGDVYIYEVSGATTNEGGSGGSGTGTSFATGANFCCFSAGDFLLAVIETRLGAAVTPGAGFTLSPHFDATNVQSNAQYATSGVSSPTSFPATSGSSSEYAEIGLVVYQTAPATPIPEYPFGLALLAVFMSIGYGLLKRRIAPTKN